MGSFAITFDLQKSWKEIFQRIFDKRKTDLERLSRFEGKSGRKNSSGYNSTK